MSGHEPWPLFLHGLAGRGKTSLGLALCDHVPRSVYLTVSEFCDQLLANQKAAVWEPFDWARYADPKLLVLDELGTRSLTEVQYDSVLRLIDKRECKPLVVISNLDLAGLARLYDDRLASRLDAGTRIEWIGLDLRSV